MRQTLTLTSIEAKSKVKIKRGGLRIPSPLGCELYKKKVRTHVGGYPYPRSPSLFPMSRIQKHLVVPWYLWPDLVVKEMQLCPAARPIPS